MGSGSDLGVARFVIVSSIGTDDVAAATAAMRPYLQAKRDADEALKQSGLDWTIVMPGHLTHAPGSGRVLLSRAFGRRADVPRDDVALVLLERRQRRTRSASSSSCSKATSRRARPSVRSKGGDAG